jgi:outer membrane protein TolC
MASNRFPLSSPVYWPSMPDSARVRLRDLFSHNRAPPPGHARNTRDYKRSAVGMIVASVPEVPCRLLALLVWFAAVPTANAQPATGGRALTLRDAVALAVRGNPALLAAGADVSIAEAGVQMARGLEDFVLEATAEGAQVRRELVAGTPVQEPGTDQLSGALQLSKPLPTGGCLGLGLVGEFSRRRFVTDLQSSAAPGPLLDAPMPGVARSAVDEYLPSLRLSLQHPLLRGFGVGVARVPRRRAAVQVDLATAQRQGVVAALLRDLENTYWDLAYATQELAIRRAAAGSAREQLRRVQANIAVGKQPRSASAEIDVAVAFRDESVLLAEQALAGRALELGRLCGLRLNAQSALELHASDVPTPPRTAVDEESTLRAALARNPELLTVRARGRAASIEVEVTDNGLLPTLDLEVVGGPSGNARDPRNAYRQLSTLDRYVIRAGLVFQVALGRSVAHGAHSVTRETQHRVRLNENEIVDQVTAAVVRAVMTADVARRRVEVLARTTEAAAIDLEAERARFEVGRSTNFDVLRRQDAVAEAQLGQLRARVDQMTALAVVDALTGQILTRHAVEIGRRGP